MVQTTNTYTIKLSVSGFCEKIRVRKNFHSVLKDKNDTFRKFVDVNFINAQKVYVQVKFKGGLIISEKHSILIF